MVKKVSTTFIKKKQLIVRLTLGSISQDFHLSLKQD